MAFTNAIARQCFQKISGFFYGKLKAADLIYWFKSQLTTVKAENDKERGLISRVRESLLFVLAESPDEDRGQFQQILRLLSIHAESDQERLKIMLRRALELRDEEAIRLLVQIYGFDINAPQDEEGNSLLHLAVKAGLMDEIVSLMDIAAANMYVKNKLGATPYHLAAAAGRLDILTFYIVNTSFLDTEQLDNHGNTPFHYALKNNQVEAMWLLIKNKANINAQDLDGNTALHLAAEFKHQTALQFLFDNKPRILRNKLDRTVLHIAAASGSKTICELIINKYQEYCNTNSSISASEKNENLLRFINAKDKNKDTAFHIAVRNANIEVVLFFLEFLKVDVNCRTQMNITPLMIATEIGDASLIKLLLDKNADVTLQNKNLQTALHIAAEEDLNDICKILVEYQPKAETKTVNLLSTNSNGFAPLHIAAVAGKTSLVEYFIKMGVDVNTTSEHGETALHLALNNGNLDLVKLLLSFDADVMAKTSNGYTALHYASKFGDVNACKLLMEHQPKLESKKADIYALDICGNSSIFTAASLGNTEVVEYFINLGIDINRKNESERTILHKAVQENYQELVKLLIRYKADVMAKDDEGNTPLHYAAEYGCLELCQLLIGIHQQAKSPSNIWDLNESNLSAFFIAVSQGDIGIIEYFLSFGTSINYSDQSGDTALHCAVDNFQEDCVAYLLEHKAEIVANKCGQTPLHIAAKNGSVEICRLLVNHKPKGADLFAKDQYDDLPISIVSEGHNKNLALSTAKFFIEECKMDVNTQGSDDLSLLHSAVENNHPRLVEYYISRKADVSLLEINGNTPLHIAVDKNSKKIVELLLQAGATHDIQNIRHYTSVDEEDDPLDSLVTVAQPEAKKTSQTAFDMAQKDSTIYKLLQNFSVNSVISNAIRKEFYLFYTSIVEVIPDLGGIIADYMNLLPKPESKDPLAESKSEGFNHLYESEKVIEIAETLLLALANELNNPGDLLALADKNNLTNATSLDVWAEKIFQKIPEPTSCKEFWKQLKEQFKKDPQHLDLVKLPSKFYYESETAKSETKEREEKHSAPVSTVGNNTVFHLPEIKSLPQQAQACNKQEVIEQKSAPVSAKRLLTNDPDAASLLPVSNSSTSSGQQVSTVKQDLEEWYWQPQPTKKVAQKTDGAEKPVVAESKSLAAKSSANEKLQHTRLGFFLEYKPIQPAKLKRKKIKSFKIKFVKSQRVSDLVIKRR